MYRIAECPNGSAYIVYIFVKVTFFFTGIYTFVNEQQCRRGSAEVLIMMRGTSGGYGHEKNGIRGNGVLEIKFERSREHLNVDDFSSSLI